MTANPMALIATLTVASLFPLLIASGSCFIKFSVVFSLLRNAIGLQQVPSNLTLHGLALIMTGFVMAPILGQTKDSVLTHGVDPSRAASIEALLDEGLAPYRKYLARYADPDLVDFFSKLRDAQASDQDDLESADIGASENATASTDTGNDDDIASKPLMTLLPAYALSELKSAFMIGFYIYLPFLVVDMLVSNILLALGMMMMSPITIALPIKLVLFVFMDGWDKVVKGLLLQYLQMPS
jgi:type III secretion apparatus YscR/HrcR family protein